MIRTSSRNVTAAFAMALVPLLLAAKGDDCAAASSTQSIAPDVSGTWAMTYADALDVTIRVGGAAYESQLAASGGVIEIEHDGRALRFDLDCARPEIVCPSEAWPQTISVAQRNVQYEHRMIVTLPAQECSEPLVAPSAEECGPTTLNPDCEEVCEGDISVRDRERFGVIDESGGSFRLYLGAGLASNGVDCALLGVSLADALLVNSGEGTELWRSEAMTAGVVTVAYGGACLWAGDPAMDEELEALVAGASVEFRAGFTGARTP